MFRNKRYQVISDSSLEDLENIINMDDIKHELHHRPMTVCEKILLQHALGHKTQFVRPGDVLRVAPDWLLSSEAAWYGMEKTYNRIGRPGFFRKDRFWLAPDHVVDPRVNHQPRPKAMIESCESIAKIGRAQV